MKNNCFNVIHLNQIEKSYNGNIVLKKVDLSISENEFLIIVGPSGSGKSTLLNIIGTIISFDSGKYLLLGEDVLKMSKTKICEIRNKEIAFIFQDYMLDDNYTAYENIEVVFLIRKEKKRDYHEKIMSALKDLNILDLSSKKVKYLSGGERQRVCIARCLAADSKIILADEPTGALDKENGDLIMNLLLSLKNKGKTIVLVTHNELYLKYATHIIRLEDGRIIQNYYV